MTSFHAWISVVRSNHCTKLATPLSNVLKICAEPGLFCLFSSFSQHNEKYITKLDLYNSIDGVLGTRTRHRRIVGEDEFTEPSDAKHRRCLYLVPVSFVFAV